MSAAASYGLRSEQLRKGTSAAPSYDWNGTTDQQLGHFESAVNYVDLVVAPNQAMFFLSARSIVRCALSACPTLQPFAALDAEASALYFSSLTTNGGRGARRLREIARQDVRRVGPDQRGAVGVLPDCAGTLTKLVHETRLFQDNEWGFGTRSPPTTPSTGPLSTASRRPTRTAAPMRARSSIAS